jgi:myotubularin-related protein 5/13
LNFKLAFSLSSVAETDSLAESGFEDAEVPEQTIKFVGRFIDKVCNEGGVSADHITALHENVRLVVAMHMEELEIVNRESKRLPPIRKVSYSLQACF